MDLLAFTGAKIKIKIKMPQVVHTVDGPRAPRVGLHLLLLFSLELIGVFDSTRSHPGGFH